MEKQTKVLKLSNGEEIITVISSADKSRPFIEVSNPLKVNLYPKPVEGGLIESMALSRWLTVSETQVANLNKQSIIAISDASIGLVRFYEHCVKKMTLSDDNPLLQQTENVKRRREPIIILTFPALFLII